MIMAKIVAIQKSQEKTNKQQQQHYKIIIIISSSTIFPNNTQKKYSQTKSHDENNNNLRIRGLRGASKGCVLDKKCFSINILGRQRNYLAYGLNAVMSMIAQQAAVDHDKSVCNRDVLHQKKMTIFDGEMYNCDHLRYSQRKVKQESKTLMLKTEASAADTDDDSNEGGYDNDDENKEVAVADNDN
jgi:hypothetical protein